MTSADVLAILTLLWHDKSETARDPSEAQFRLGEMYANG